jgi:O-antigen ligase
MNKVFSQNNNYGVIVSTLALLMAASEGLILNHLPPGYSIAFHIALAASVMIILSPKFFYITCIIFLNWFPFQAILGGKMRELGTELGGVFGLSVTSLVLVMVVILGFFWLGASKILKDMITENFQRPFLFMCLFFIGLLIVHHANFLEGARRVFKILYAIMFLPLTFYLIKSRSAVLSTIDILNKTGIVVTLFGFVFFIFRDIFPGDAPEMQQYYGYAGWAWFAMFFSLLATCNLSLWLGLGVKRFRNYFLLFGAQPLLASVRTPAAVFLISVIFVLFFFNKKLWSVFIVVIGILAFFATPMMSRMFYAGFDPQNVDGMASLWRNLNTNGRNIFWNWMLTAMDDGHWIYGTGFGAWNILASEKMGRYYQAHGEYMQVLFENGLMGLLAFLFPFAVLWRQLWQMRAKNRDALSRSLIVSSFAAIMIYLLTGITDNTFDYYTFGAYVFSILGLAFRSCKLESSYSLDKRRVSIKAVQLSL